MAFVNMHIFSLTFLHFDKSLLLLTVSLRGVSNKHCLLSLFSFTGKLCSNHFSNKEQFAVYPETYTQYGYENTKASLKEDAVPDIPIEVAP